MANEKGMDGKKGMDSGELVERVQALRLALPAEGLALQASWQVGRVFNALLSQAKQMETDDIVIRTIGSIRPDPRATDEHLALADNATVGILCAQLEAALSRRLA